MNNIKFHKKG